MKTVSVAMAAASGGKNESLSEFALFFDKGLMGFDSS